MPEILSTLQREKPPVVTLKNGKTIAFREEGGQHIADVDDAESVKELLAIPEGYVSLEAKTPSVKVDTNGSTMIATDPAAVPAGRDGLEQMQEDLKVSSAADVTKMSDDDLAKTYEEQMGSKPGNMKRETMIQKLSEAKKA